MIKDNLANAKCYYNLSPNLRKGLEWLQNTSLNTIPDGKYVIDGEKLFANVQTYETKDDAPYEKHQKYIDIQYMIIGSEKIGVTDVSNCAVIEKYNPEKDVEFLVNNAEPEYQILQAGNFLVFFPQDAHQPALKLEEKSIVKKVIVKAAI